MFNSFKDAASNGDIIYLSDELAFKNFPHTIKEIKYSKTALARQQGEVTQGQSRGATRLAGRQLVSRGAWRV